MAQSPVSNGLGKLTSTNHANIFQNFMLILPSRLVHTRSPQPPNLAIRLLRQLGHIPLRHLRQLIRPRAENVATLLQRRRRGLRRWLLPLVQAQRRKANGRLGLLHFRQRLHRHTLLRLGVQRHRRYREEERAQQPCGAATWTRP
jgi:hypothetical protein